MSGRVKVDRKKIVRRGIKRAGGRGMVRKRVARGSK